MSVKLSTRAFAPSLWMTLLTLVVVLGFVRLGFWQLHRADEKRALLTAYATGQQSVVDLNAARARQLPRYQRVRVSGHFDSAHQVLLDNMPAQNGRAGFRVLTPLKQSDGHLVLVDRGWIAMGASRTALPDIQVPQVERMLIGQLDQPPEPGVRLGGPLEIPATWPKLLNFPRQADLDAVYGPSLIPGIVLLDPKADDGYERVWQAHFGFGPERHLAYAVQWFALAVAVAITFVVVNLKPRNS